MKPRINNHTKAKLFLTECSGGTYGADCAGLCGNCLYGGDCDKRTGNCTSGCNPGYYGSLCTEGIIYICKHFVNSIDLSEDLDFYISS